MPEPPCKPGSVSAGRPAAANIHLRRALPRASCGLYPEARPGRSTPRVSARTPPYLPLHRVGFAVPRRSPGARCALTAPFHPCHARLAAPFGGLFSVALSCGSPRPAVGRHPALRCPDFPRRTRSPTRSPGRLRRSEDNPAPPRRQTWGGASRGDTRSCRSRERARARKTPAAAGGAGCNRSSPATGRRRRASRGSVTPPGSRVARQSPPWSWSGLTRRISAPPLPGLQGRKSEPDPPKSSPAARSAGSETASSPRSASSHPTQTSPGPQHDRA